MLHFSYPLLWFPAQITELAGIDLRQRLEHLASTPRIAGTQYAGSGAVDSSASAKPGGTDKDQNRWPFRWLTFCSCYGVSADERS